MPFSRGKNAYLAITRGSASAAIYPTGGTIECWVSTATGPYGSTNRMNYPPTITGGYDTEFVPTDTILFEVPKSYNTALDLHEDDTFTISGASPQENGTYKLMGRPVIIPTPKATSSTRFRCWVRKQR